MIFFLLLIIWSIVGRGIINDNNSFSRIISFHSWSFLFNIYLLHTHTHTHILTSSHAFADRVSRESESMLAYIGWIRLSIHACALCSVLTARYHRYIFHFGRTSSLYFPHHLLVVLYMMSAIHGARLNQYIRYLYISYIYTTLLYGLLLLFNHSSVFVFLAIAIAVVGAAAFIFVVSFCSWFLSGFTA